MTKAPDCPKGHGAMSLRGVDDFQGSNIRPDGLWANYQCMDCGEWKSQRTDDPAPGLCDFCSSPDPVKLIPCRDIRGRIYLVPLPDGQMTEWRSEGPWAACKPCLALVEADDQRGLTRRAVNLHMARARRGSPEDMVTTAFRIAQLHKLFFEHRIR